MLIRQPWKIMDNAFVSEHAVILKRSLQVCEFANDHVNSLKTDFQGKDFDPSSIEKIIVWKQSLKQGIRQFADHVKDHVERETAFLDSFVGSGLEPEDLKRNEEVVEHLDELIWILDNTPDRKMIDMLVYIQQKIDELCQGVSHHCQWGNEALEMFEEPW